MQPRPCPARTHMQPGTTGKMLPARATRPPGPAKSPMPPRPAPATGCGRAGDELSLGDHVGADAHGCTSGAKLHPRREVGSDPRPAVGGLRVLAQLKHPDVSRDGPSVARGNPGGVRIHGPKAARHHVEVMADRLLAQLFAGIRRRRIETAPDDHAPAVAQLAVAGRAVDPEAFLPALEDRAVNREWKGFGSLPCDLPV